MQPFQIVSVRASKARRGKGGDEKTRFQSFPGESGTSLRGTGVYLASHTPPTPPSPASFPSPPPPVCAFGIPRPAAPVAMSVPKLSFMEQFGSKAELGESPRSCWARGGGYPGAYTCVLTHAVPPHLRRDRVRFFFAFTFCFLNFFSIRI